MVGMALPRLLVSGLRDDVTWGHEFLSISTSAMYLYALFAELTEAAGENSVIVKGPVPR